jgi:hypothetical protein
MSSQHSKILDDLRRRSSGICAVFTGKKFVGGQETGDDAVVLGVDKKLPRDEVPEGQMLPEAVDGITTDIEEVGEILAVPPRRAGAETGPDLRGLVLGGIKELRRRARDPEHIITEGIVDDLLDLIDKLCGDREPPLTGKARPVQPGFSTGHPDITAGTWGLWLFVDGEIRGLSNNHVWADVNRADLGDTLIQPGRYDGGDKGRDDAGVLDWFEPIRFGSGETNLVDAATCVPVDGVFDPAVSFEIPRGVGVPAGIVPLAEIAAGQPAKKVGRTTALSNGLIRGRDAALNVGYGDGKTARFIDQILYTDISDPGDSGSGILSEDNRYQALLYAGSDFVTVGSPMEIVLELRGATIALP